jgi:hypothetical protein
VEEINYFYETRIAATRKSIYIVAEMRIRQQKEIMLKKILWQWQL